MQEVTIVCDRCGRTVKGLESAEGTAGFYRRGPAWEKYMVRHEQVVCDDCLQHSLAYQDDHPTVPYPVQSFAHAVLTDKDMTPAQKLGWLRSYKPSDPPVPAEWIAALEGLERKRAEATESQEYHELPRRTGAEGEGQE